MSDFEGKTVVVAGAGSGIGAEVAVQLAAGGARVFALDRSSSGLTALRGRVANPDVMTFIECDIADEPQVVRAFAEIRGSVCGINGLVNAAGIVVTAKFLELTAEDWNRVFSVNVLGTYLLLKHGQPLLAAGESGRVVNFSSMAGKIPGEFTAPYAASKAAVISITRSAAVALAPQITVNCVCPGVIDTPMWEQLDAELKGLGARTGFRERAGQAPLGRPGTSDDVVGVVLFLLSDAARFVTGEDVNVTGGLVMH